MSLERFLTDNEPTWTELEDLIRRAGTRPTRLGGTGIRRLGELYRAATADLAQARRRYPAEAVVSRLEHLVIRARALVYARPRRTSVARFFATDYWRLLVERRLILGLACGLLLLPGAIGFAIAMVRPDRAASIVPAAFLWVTEQQATGTDLGLSTGGLAAFSTFVLTNNIRVALLAFAAGITWGLGTAAVIIQNGLILGAVVGLGIEAGNTALLVEAIAAHGILELSCIIAAAVAGLRMASGLVMPGTRPRRVALVEEARPAVLLAVGTAPFLVVAGLVEGFVSRTGTPAGPAVLIGLLLGGGYWVLAVVRGTGEQALPAQPLRSEPPTSP